MNLFHTFPKICSILFIGLCLSQAHSGFLNPGADLEIDSGYVMSPLTPFTPQRSTTLPEPRLDPWLFGDIIEESYPCRGETDFREQAELATLARTLQKDLADETIQGLFTLGARYPHELKSESPIFFEEVLGFLNTLGDIEKEYAGTSEVAYDLMRAQESLDRLPDWEKRKRCLRLSAQLLAEIEDKEIETPKTTDMKESEVKTAHIINWVYTFSTNITSLENHYCLIGLLKEFIQLNPYDYLDQLYDIWKEVDYASSAKWIVFFEGYLHRAHQENKNASQSYTPSSQEDSLSQEETRQVDSTLPLFASPTAYSHNPYWDRSPGSTDRSPGSTDQTSLQESSLYSEVPGEFDITLREFIASPGGTMGNHAPALNESSPPLGFQ